MTFPDRRPFGQRVSDRLRAIRRVVLPAGLLVLMVGLWIADPRFDAIATGHGDGAAFTGTVSRVIDGDSLALAVGPVQTEVRLAGIDAPEYRQTCRTAAGAEWPCGTDAMGALTRLVAKGTLVRCTGLGADRYSRTLAYCAVGEADVGEAMVRSGHAVARRDDRDDPGAHYAAAENAARAARNGVWQGPFTNPADWRRGEGLAGEGQPMRLRDWLAGLLTP